MMLLLESSIMAKITVYHYELFDSHAGTTIRSKTPATRRAIDAAGGKLLPETAREVDLDAVSDDGVVVRWPPTKGADE
jgi:hypothetical protein